MEAFSFTCLSQDKDTGARTGVIHTPHGDIETPAFVPVGTQCSVKSLAPDELRTLDVNLFFVNTYHAYLRPGIPVIKKFGGLHAFMGWDRPLITDSGGFQVFSLGRKRFFRKSEEGKEEMELVRIQEDGVTFKSHWDGSSHVFTPESSMEYQWALGADIHIAFDDCTPYPVSYDKAQISMERTHRWAKRSLDEHKKIAMQNPSGFYQALYGSIQGSVYEDLRKASASYITSLPFDGFAIGGVSVGESKKVMADVLSWVTPLLPLGKPRHLLGVGEIDDIFTLVASGIDTFDCVQPTRLARMGQVFISPSGKKEFHDEKICGAWTIDLTKAMYAFDTRPIDPTCTCTTCQEFSRGYLSHLFHVRELLAYRLATVHNIFMMTSLVKNIRQSILTGTFASLQSEWME